MAVTGYGGRRTLFDEDQGCYRTSSGNHEKRFGRGCVQTSAAVDGGRSIPPTPLFSCPSDGEREYQRWNAYRRVRSPPPSHRYLRHHSPPSPSSSSSQHPIHIYHHQPSSPSINSSTHSRRPNQSQKHHTRETHKPQFHRFKNTHENQFETTKTHSRFSHHNSVTKYKPPNHQFVNHQTKTNITISLISLTAGHENQFSKIDCHSTEIHFQPQNMASTNSDSKPRPTLPRNRPTTLIDMMHFVSNWFDCEEILMDEITESENFARIEEDLTKYEVGVSKSEEVVVSKSEFDNEIIEANKNEEDGRLLCDCEEIWVDESDESERISKIESELCKNEIGDDAFCDELGEERNAVTWTESNSAFSFPFEKYGYYSSSHRRELDNFHYPDGSLLRRKEHARLLGWDSENVINERTSSAISQNTKLIMNPKSLTSWGNNHVWNLDDGFGRLGASGLCESPLIRKHPSSLYSLPPPDVTSNFQDEFGRHYIEDKEDIAADLNHCPLALSPRPSYLSLTEDSDHETTFNASMSFLPPGNHHWFMSKFPIERFGPSKKGSAEKLKTLGDASSVVRKASTLSPTIDPDLENEDQAFGLIVGTLCMKFKNDKTKGARQCQWQIAWAFSAFRWTIVLVPLWIWDELRREFSIGVYHSHKPNMGFCSIVFQRVHFRVLQPNSRSSSFQRKGD